MKIGYEISIANAGNQALDTVTVVDTLPNTIEYYALKTGTFGYTGIDDELAVEYTIDYTTVGGNTGVFGPYNTNVDTEESLDDIIASGDNIKTLTWNIEQLSVGITSKTPIRIDGTVKDTVEDDETIVNELRMTHETGGTTTSVPASKSTIVQDSSVIQTSFDQTYKSTPINPGTVIRYSIGADARSSRLNNPIMAIIMPDELEYIGNATIEYVDYFADGTEPTLPPAIIVEDINENGDNAVKFEFKDDYAFDFRQKSTVTISFDAQVAVGATDTFETFMILNTIDNIESIPSTEDTYDDTANIADDATVSSTYAKSTVYSNDILFFVGTKSKKYVKGALDVDYVEEPTIGMTKEGGLVDYKISISNIGNAELQKIEIVDILPYIGDTGVIDVDTARESQFSVYAINDVTAKIIKEDGTEETTAFEIYYSESEDPVRTGSSYTTIGTVDDWSLEPPEDLTNIKSIKVVTYDIIVTPSDIFEVDVSGVAPVGVTEDQIAWNSFSAVVSFTTYAGEQDEMVAIEPQKVGVQIYSSTENTGTVTGFTWFDTNKDGLPTDGEAGVNGIGAMLLDETGTIVAYIFSSPDAKENDGYYTLTDIPYGTYTMQFFNYEEYSYTTQVLDDDTGSKVNQSTGIVEAFTISEENQEITINAGVIDKEATSIKTLLEVNKSANSVLKNVVRNQMLLGMKTADTIELINKLDK